MKYLIYIVILYAVYRWFTRSIPLSGLSLIFANKGTGKTSFLAHIAHRKGINKKYKNIYCNMPVMDTKKIVPEKDFGIKYIKDSLTLIDEADSVFSNKKFLTQEQQDYFRMQRHYKSTHKNSNDIVLVSQSWDTLNKDCRRLYERCYIAKKAWMVSIFTGQHYTKLCRIKKYIDIDEVTKKPTDYYEFYFFLWGVTYFNRKPTYKWFDSLYHEALPDMRSEQWPESEGFKKKRMTREQRQKYRKEMKKSDNKLAALEN